MAWLRVGDNTALNPIVLRVASLVRRVRRMVNERDVAVCEVFGFVTLCATASASHWQDYSISEGVAMSVSPARWERLLKLAVDAGYLEQGKADGVVSYRLIKDPNFLHMIEKAEKAWKDEQKSTNGKDWLIKVVRARDGDGCRYCRVVVNWNDRVGGIGGTYDHRQAGEKPQQPTDLVVACRSCNSGRRDHDKKLLPDAESKYPLLPEPATPFYSEYSANFLAERGIDVTSSDTLRPGQYVPATAHGSDPVDTGSRATTASDPVVDDTTGLRADPASDPTGPRAGTVSDPRGDTAPTATPPRDHASASDLRGDYAAHTSDEPAPVSGPGPGRAAARQAPEASRTGSGRDGSGRAPRLGTGPPATDGRRRRSRRGKRPPDSRPEG